MGQRVNSLQLLYALLGRIQKRNCALQEKRKRCRSKISTFLGSRKSQKMIVLFTKLSILFSFFVPWMCFWYFSFIPRRLNIIIRLNESALKSTRITSSFIQTHRLSLLRTRSQYPWRKFSQPSWVPNISSSITSMRS